MTGSLWVDTRWNGVSGIGRFSREVTSRLRPGWKALSGGSPSSPRDAVNPRRLLVPAGDLIYSPGYNGGMGRAAQLLTLHDLMHLRSEHSALRARYYEMVIRPIVTRCGAVLTVSETSRSVIEEWLDDSSVRVINVGNGLSVTGTSSAASSDQPTGHPRMLYVGNMKPHKNFPTVARIAAAMEEWALDVVTTDPSEATEMIAAVPGLQNKARVLSRISDEELAQVYASATAVLMPSSEEGFGLPAVEALAADRRVVHWGGCEAISEVLGPFGVSTPDLDNVSGWQASLLRAAAMPRPSEQDGFDEWLRRYDWNDVATRVQAVLDDLGDVSQRGTSE